MRAGLWVALLTISSLLAFPADAVAAAAAAAPPKSGAGFPATLVPGKPVRITSAAPFNLHAIDGASGLWVHVSLAVPGAAALTLYAADGAEVLSVEGEDAIKLDAVLSVDQVYYLGVVRTRAGQPYTLSLQTEEPDLHMALFSMLVGYASKQIDQKTNQEYETRTCWLEPGIKMRRIYPKGTEDIAIGRGGMEYASFQARNGRGGTVEREIQFDGDRVTYHTLTGHAQDHDVELESLFGFNDDRFHSYLCKADDT